jgi:molybdenum cofactor cytidylyltransferase
MRIVGILLAAGQGRRFGGEKLLAGLADGTAVGAQSARRLHAALEEVVAVVKPGDDRLADLLRAEGVRVDVCPEAVRGMGDSLAHAVRATSDADGWVVALADMPLIEVATIRRVARALTAGALIAAPVYRGKRGHPVGFAASLGERLAQLTGDAGAREIVRSEAARVQSIEVEDAGVLADIDTPAQLQALATPRADS